MRTSAQASGTHQPLRPSCDPSARNAGRYASSPGFKGTRFHHQPSPCRKNCLTTPVVEQRALTELPWIDVRQLTVSREGCADVVTTEAADA
jgi:hypothetical protein